MRVCTFTSNILPPGMVSPSTTKAYTCRVSKVEVWAPALLQKTTDRKIPVLHKHIFKSLPTERGVEVIVYNEDEYFLWLKVTEKFVSVFVITFDFFLKFGILALEPTNLKLLKFFVWEPSLLLPVWSTCHDIDFYMLQKAACPVVWLMELQMLVVLLWKLLVNWA